MAILNPDHLFEQAEKLIGPPPAGRPRQVDVRRAISSAYYGLFHFILTEVADEFVGVTQRASDRYALVYRSISHAIFKQLCSETKKAMPSAKYAPISRRVGLIKIPKHLPRRSSTCRKSVISLTIARSLVSAPLRRDLPSAPPGAPLCRFNGPILNAARHS